MSKNRDRSHWWRCWAERGAAMTVVSVVFCLMVFTSGPAAGHATIALGLTLPQWLALLCLALSTGGTGLCLWVRRAKGRPASLASH